MGGREGGRVGGRELLDYGTSEKGYQAPTEGGREVGRVTKCH